MSELNNGLHRFWRRHRALAIFALPPILFLALVVCTVLEYLYYVFILSVRNIYMSSRGAIKLTIRTFKDDIWEGGRDEQD